MRDITLSVPESVPHGVRRPMSVGLGTLLLFSLLASAPVPALASLGGDLSSIGADAAGLGASAPAAIVSKAAGPASAASQTSAPGTFTVHQLVTPSGTVVREYVDASGQVFGVAWQGPTIPDLRQLLGTYFTPYSTQLSAGRAAHPGRGPAFVDTDTLVVHSGGHMRSFEGQAYLPQLLPQGVLPANIQ